jgi:hypothetical protein
MIVPTATLRQSSGNRGSVVAIAKLGALLNGLTVAVRAIDGESAVGKFRLPVGEIIRQSFSLDWRVSEFVMTGRADARLLASPDMGRIALFPRSNARTIMIGRLTCNAKTYKPMKKGFETN